MILREAAPQTVSRCLEARPGAGRGPSTSDKKNVSSICHFNKILKKLLTDPKNEPHTSENDLSTQKFPQL